MISGRGGGKIRKELIPNIHTTAFLTTGYFTLFTVKVDDKSLQPNIPGGRSLTAAVSSTEPP